MASHTPWFCQQHLHLYNVMVSCSGLVICTVVVSDQDSWSDLDIVMLVCASRHLPTCSMRSFFALWLHRVWQSIPGAVYLTNRLWSSLYNMSATSERSVLSSYVGIQYVKQRTSLVCSYLDKYVHTQEHSHTRSLPFRDQCSCPCLWVWHKREW